MECSRLGGVMGDIGTDRRYFSVRDAYWLAISSGLGGDLCFWFDVGVGVTGRGPGLVFEVTAQSEMVGRQAANDSSFVRHIYLPSAHIHSYNRRLDRLGGRVVELGGDFTDATQTNSVIPLKLVEIQFVLDMEINKRQEYIAELNKEYLDSIEKLTPDKIKRNPLIDLSQADEFTLTL